MSIFGAMFSGVTGLNAQSQALGMIADNIANMNTVGYKGIAAQFFSLVTQAASRTTFTPGGVAAAMAEGDAVDSVALLRTYGPQAGLAMLALTADRGGNLVYRHGVGVTPEVVETLER